MMFAAFTARVTAAALDWIGGADGDAQAPRKVNTVKPAACQRTPLSYHDGYPVRYEYREGRSQAF
jgi:hypothetical protein